VAQHLDVDKLLPPARTFTLAGETVDVSMLPSKLVLELARNRAKFEQEGDEAFDLILDKVEQMCKRSNPVVTKEWLMEHSTIQQLMAVIEFVLAPLTEMVEGKKEAGKQAEGSSKNE